MSGGKRGRAQLVAPPLRSSFRAAASLPGPPPRRVSSSPRVPSLSATLVPPERASPGSSGRLGKRRQGDSQLNPGEIPTGLHHDWQLRGPVGAGGWAPLLLWVCSSAIQESSAPFSLSFPPSLPAFPLSSSVLFSSHFFFFFSEKDRRNSERRI